MDRILVLGRVGRNQAEISYSYNFHGRAAHGARRRSKLRIWFLLLLKTEGTPTRQTGAAASFLSSEKHFLVLDSTAPLACLLACFDLLYLPVVHYTFTASQGRYITVKP